MRRWIKALLLAFFKLRYRKASPPVPLPTSPRRILISNIASFGDAVIATAVLPPLKRRYPDAKIGFLVSSEGKEALQDHPDVDLLHTFDHWVKHRGQGICKALFRHSASFRQAKRQLRSASYDLAIDLYPRTWINAFSLLKKGNIPARLGYQTEGFSPLLTHGAPPRPPEYLGKTHLHLLSLLGIDPNEYSPYPCYFSKADSPCPGATVVHMGTANPLKEWDTAKWTEVVRELLKRGETVVLTGKGKKEQARCDEVERATGCKNLCGKLSFAEFAAAVQQAKRLLSVDSAAVHLASAVKTPCVVLFAGISDTAVWKPPYAKALMHFPPCAPCLQGLGCRSMACIQKLSVSEVLLL